MAWGKKKSEPKRDWSVGPIGPGEWAQHALPHPDSMAMVQQSIVMSGVDPAGVDRVDALCRVWNILLKIGDDLLQRDPVAQNGLRQVGSRPDLSDELIWDYFTHQGAIGIAARNHLIETYVQTGQLVEVLAQLLQDGQMSIGLEGRERI